MHSITKISLLIATVAVLGACGVSEEPLSGQAPPPAPAPGTPPPPAPPAVACTAPDPASELSFRSSYIGACFPSGKTGSQRTDFVVESSFVTEYSTSYTDSTVCEGTSTLVTGFYNKLDVGTTTVASLAANGTTTVGGNGYQIQLSLSEGTGTLSGLGTTTLTLCKSTPSATTRSAANYFFNPFVQIPFTPTFSIRLSLPDTTTIVTTPAFDNSDPICFDCGG
jgi:hypothetical protein